jgi:methyltransferase-like protein
LSPSHIQSARRTAAALGLSNVRFEALSITDVSDHLGSFDYIISHGVYSWVPPQVQRALLRVCKRNLAPNGIAYVSYNTYPGWNLRGIIREMLLLHDRPELSATERVTRGRELVQFMATTIPDSERIYSALLREEFALLSGLRDSYFLHEELEAENRPVYFREFIARANEEGLRYISEAAPSSWDVQLTNEIRARMRSWAKDDVSYEQYLDFLRGRSFRRTLLCHDGVHVDEEVSPEPIKAMYLSARSRNEKAGPGEPPGSELFRTPDGVAVTMNHPVVIAALHALVDARPTRLSFFDLLDQTRARLAGRNGEITPDLLADMMLRCALVTLIKLHTVPAACATTLSERPRVSELARLQVSHGEYVTSLTNQNLELDAVARLVVANADGTCSHDDFVRLCRAALARGELNSKGKSPPASEQLPAAVSAAIEHLFVGGLFVG